MAKGPFKLITVNKVPERAHALLGRVIQELKDRYTIEHVENVEREDCRAFRTEVQILMPIFRGRRRWIRCAAKPAGCFGQLLLEILKFSTCRRIKSLSHLTMFLQMSASMWTKEEVEKIQHTARTVKSNIVTVAIPFGLHAEQGANGIV